MVTGNRQEAFGRIHPSPGLTRLRRVGKLPRVSNQVCALNRIPDRVQFHTRLPRRFAEAVHRLARVRRLREPQADWPALRALNEGGVEVEHQVEESLPFLSVQMGKDRMEWRGHHETRGARDGSGGDRTKSRWISLQVPDTGLRVNIHRCGNRGSRQNEY